MADSTPTEPERRAAIILNDVTYSEPPRECEHLVPAAARSEGSDR